jgi:hypothetical protein
MWLPVLHTYWRNETARNISAGKYSNLRLMTGNSGTHPRGDVALDKNGFWPVPYGGVNGSNAWMTAAQAAPDGCVDTGTCPVFDIGGACWYFAQGLADLGLEIPIAVADTAIGGQHIEEFMINSTISNCNMTARDVMGHDFGPWGNAQVYGSQVVPFLDMTIKGIVWYQVRAGWVRVCRSSHLRARSLRALIRFRPQGENNMGFTKGNSAANVGYSCLMRELVNGYRRVWSATPGTTDPLFPFGAVALPSGGNEGGPHMGAMRIAQTAGHGVLPNAELPNSWIVQAYDLEDQWASNGGPCFSTAPGYGPNLAWACCATSGYNATKCAGREALCAPACAASIGTTQVMGGAVFRARQLENYFAALGARTGAGLELTFLLAFLAPGIHPRSKKPVGERLARGAFNTVYGGTGSVTGPTLSSCAVSGASLTVNFDAALLRGDTIVLQPAFPQVKTRYLTNGGTLLWALSEANASTYCIEPLCVMNETSGRCATAPNGRGNLGEFCPTWAGGDGVTVLPPGVYAETGWVMLPFTTSPSGTGIVADLSPLNGTAPAAIRYAWDLVNCCDLTDPTLWVTHDCIALCPIMSTAGLPANPFHAKIVDGACACQPPQVCG